jgi:hypothetical protein
MGITPDRQPGARLEEELQLTDEGLDPSVIGGLVNNGGTLKGRDSLGVFNLRSGSGLSAADHRTLRQLIHFIDEGPAEGFASGAYRELTGTVFPTAITWYDDNTKVKKLVEKLVTYAGAFPTQIQWKIYDTDGTTVLATVTDAISYSGPFETSRTRTIA